MLESKILTNLLTFWCVSFVLGNLEFSEDQDTVIIQATEEGSELDMMANGFNQNRMKRQLKNPDGSIFTGFPGFDGNIPSIQFPNFGSNTGIGGVNQIPSLIGGIHQQFPQFQPINPKPSEGVVSSSCRRPNGIHGTCVQLRQCYPLLFSSSQEELSYAGLASTLEETAGACIPKTPYGTIFYAINGPSNGKDKKICCALEDTSSNSLVTSRPPSAVDNVPTKPSTTPWPSWSPDISSTTEIAEAEPYNCAGFYVIGGSNVIGRPYPWIVSIKDGRTNRHVCGGSLISPRSILSAAHCVQQLDGSRVANMRVYLGANDITNDGRCTIVKKVRNIKYHRGFSMRTLHHDIAIVTLESPVTLNSNVQTVTLGTSRVSPGSSVTVAGWGGVYFGGGTVGQLRSVSFDVISNKVCAAKYVGHAPAGITQHQMCAGSQGRDSCVGDSGGPLMQNGVQIAVVSFGVDCGTKPGVYTRVSSYLSWINKNKS